MMWGGGGGGQFAVALKLHWIQSHFRHHCLCIATCRGETNFFLPCHLAAFHRLKVRGGDSINLRPESPPSSHILSLPSSKVFLSWKCHFRASSQKNENLRNELTPQFYKLLLLFKILNLADKRWEERLCSSPALLCFWQVPTFRPTPTAT